MPNSASKNAPKIDRMELAKALLDKSESHLAEARNWHRKQSYAESMRQALDSIECSTHAPPPWHGF